MFTRCRKPTQDNICPFVYHYFMTFLKQRTFEIQPKTIKVHMVSIGISAQRTNKRKTDKTQRRVCSVELRRHGQALCLLCTQRSHCITIKRRAGSELDSFSRDSDQFYLKVSNDARYPEVSHVIVLILCITISNLVRIY